MISIQELKENSEFLWIFNFLLSQTIDEILKKVKTISTPDTINLLMS